MYKSTQYNNLLIHALLLFIYYVFFKESTSGTYKAIGDMLRADPTLLFSTSNELLNNVMHRRAVYPGVRIFSHLFFFNYKRLHYNYYGAII